MTRHFMLCKKLRMEIARAAPSVGSVPAHNSSNKHREWLSAWFKMSGLPLKKFFNTSGLLYKSMELKTKLPKMSEEEQLKLLATDGMLVKRPLVIGKDFVLVGFKESEWSEKLK